MAQSVSPTLYDPSFEHDSCGFGLVAQIDGRASAWVVDTAFEALAKLSHRGGVNADGVSGDGCGVLIHTPAPWLRALAHRGGYRAGRTLCCRPGVSRSGRQRCHRPCWKNIWSRKV